MGKCFTIEMSVPIYLLGVYPLLSATQFAVHLFSQALQPSVCVCAEGTSQKEKSFP
jgi:hypothetical protein